MANWSPSNGITIGAAEHLGRRRFKRSQLIGFGQQEPKNELTHFDFLETRDYEISVDRLGRNGVDNQIIERLLPLAESNADKRTPRMVFIGWASVQVKKFLIDAQKLRYSIKPDPIKGTESEDNEYRALICCPTDREHIEIALTLAHLFNKHGMIHGVESLANRSLSLSIQEWFKRLTVKGREFFK